MAYFAHAQIRHWQAASHLWYAAVIVQESLTGRSGTAAASVPSRRALVTCAVPHLW